MAPTLFGRHKECDCAKCGYKIIIGASDEVDPDTGYLNWSVDSKGDYLGGPRIKSAVCPNCGFENTDLESRLAFNGDYEFGEPQRFDVFVFKWPEHPETNYIKRLVGLPNETIRIKQGDLHLWNPDSNPAEQILRKDSPDKQRAIQLPVYDDEYPPRELIAAGWPERWHGMAAANGAATLAGWSDTEEGWKLNDDGAHRTYAVSASPDEAWLRYRHYLPRPNDWEELEAGRTQEPTARLISDFCGYNAYTADGGREASRARDIDYGPFWVSDLTVSFELKLSDPSEGASVLLELVDGVHRYRCRIDPATGEATLIHGRAVGLEIEEEELAKADCGIDGDGSYDVQFANVDDRLCLWIDGDLVDFEEAASYARPATENSLPTRADLTPVGIAVKGMSAEVTDLLLERDIYYRAESNDRDPSAYRRRLMDNLENPEAWASIYIERALDYDQLDLEIKEDRYLALGDNSPRSSDSRLWTSEQTVPRNYLVGKAFYIYWPHGVPFMNDGRGYTVWSHTAHSTGPGGDGYVSVDDYPKYTIPFYPQVGRMERIR
jgi:signal peptidase I